MLDSFFMFYSIKLTGKEGRKMDNNLFSILADIRERIVGLETKFETMGDTNTKATQAILKLNAWKLERIVA